MEERGVESANCEDFHENRDLQVGSNLKFEIGLGRRGEKGKVRPVTLQYVREQMEIRTNGTLEPAF